jgi:hypothetical protein
MLEAMETLSLVIAICSSSALEVGFYFVIFSLTNPVLANEA